MFHVCIIIVQKLTGLAGAAEFRNYFALATQRIFCYYYGYLIRWRIHSILHALI